MTESRALIDHFFRQEYGRLVARLTRRFGVSRLESIEDWVQSALVRAMRSWPLRGIPPDPGAWLSAVAQNMALDQLRREGVFQKHRDQFANSIETHEMLNDVEETIPDDQLRMLFLCCQPDLSAESQVALALKIVCGFGVEEIAKALLSPEDNIRKRLTRAKQTLRDIDWTPGPLAMNDLAERREAVHTVLYLLFNEAYHASHGEELLRRDLGDEALRLAGILAEHPQFGSPASDALFALFILQAARFESRISDDGRLQLLEDQDRSKWNAEKIELGFAWLERAARGEELSRYHLEAAIVAEHCRSPEFGRTDWRRILELYSMLCERSGNWVHELNRAIALGQVNGAQAGLTALLAAPPPSEARYSHWHSARGEFLRRCGQVDRAREAFAEALECTRGEIERNWLESKLRECI